MIKKKKRKKRTAPRLVCVCVFVCVSSSSALDRHQDSHTHNIHIHTWKIWKRKCSQCLHRNIPSAFISDSVLFFQFISLKIVHNTQQPMMDTLSHWSESENDDNNNEKKNTFCKIILCAIVLLCSIELSGMRVVAFPIEWKWRKKMRHPSKRGGVCWRDSASGKITKAN